MQGSTDEVPAALELGLPAPDPAAALALGLLRERMFGVREPLRIGRYIVLEELGRGAMGVVFAAYDRELDRKVALKVLHAEQGDPARRERLLREARALARVSHPNVVQVFEVGEHEGNVFIAMAFVDGCTLRRWAEPRRSLTDLLEAYRQAGEGLAAAHGARVVHRDFKPDNVLVDRRGRVFVVDFGLAREGSDRPEELGESTSPAERAALQRTSATRTGAVVGTPAYMAPEQHAGARADARSDQYAFCVSLFEAVHGHRPGADGPPNAEPMRRRRVPRWLDSLLVRGLDPRPEARFEAMDVLLERLRRRGARARLRTLGVAATIVLAAGTAVVAFREDATQCEASAAARLREVWGEAHRARVAVAFARTERPYAAVAGTRVSAALDAWGGAWSASYGELCVATRSGALDPEVLDRRSWCLRDRLARTGTVVQAMARADSAIVDSVDDHLARLPDSEACSLDAELAGALGPPDTPEDRTELARLREVLGHAQTDRLAGRFDEALGKMDEVSSQARALGYKPLIAEVDSEAGRLQTVMAAVDRGTVRLEAAFLLATELAYDEIAFESARNLAFAFGAELLDTAAAERWLRTARSLTVRNRSGPREVAALDNTVGAIANESGQWSLAISAFERSIASIEAQPVADEAATAAARGNLALALAESGRWDDAVEQGTRALDSLVAQWGPLHPEVGSAHTTLGKVLAIQGERLQARTHFEVALRVTETARGNAHPETAIACHNLGTVLYALGQPEDALPLLHRALAIRERDPLLRRDAATTHASLGGALMHLERYDAAENELRAAVRDFDAAGATPLERAVALVALGHLELARERTEVALPWFEAALALREEANAPAHLVAEARVGVGVSLWFSAPDQRARAVRQLERAREEFQRMGEDGSAEFVVGWLAEHASERPDRVSRASP
jgi:tetratricopeptide (TPR) repeat protein/predicted Ser/Thr protein kinase